MNGGRHVTPTGDKAPRRSRLAGVSLVELLVVVCAGATLAAVAAAGLTSGREQFRVAGAARHLAAFLLQTRSVAAQSGQIVAVQFGSDAARPSMARILDGNRNGVRAVDISRGVDRQVEATVMLAVHFPGVEFGLVAGATDIETGALLTGSGVRAGAGGLLSFAPAGSSTSGTVYLRGRGDCQYAVRVLGGTGRVRVLRFDSATRQWRLP